MSFRAKQRVTGCIIIARCFFILNKLEQARADIDAADKQLAVIFEKRMAAVREVVSYKRENNFPILDGARENAVIEKGVARISDEELKPYFADFLRSTMRVSRDFQSKLIGDNVVAYQGVPGAFTHIAMKRMFPNAEAKSCAGWSDVFDAVESGEAHFGVLPFENSYAGDVSEVLDLCFAHKDIFVSSMYDLPVVQNLLGVCGSKLSDIKKAVSHPQALAQSANFLKKLGIETQSYPNTAAAAKYVSQTNDKSTAAIASAETAELYGLEIIAEGINEAKDNTTRFIVIGKSLPIDGERFSLLFTVKNEAGSLARVIQLIGEMGCNMVSIKSRPMPHMTGEYYFYTELIGSAADSKKLTQALNAVCTSVRTLGIYGKS